MVGWGASGIIASAERSRKKLELIYCMHERSKTQRLQTADWTTLSNWNIDTSSELLITMADELKAAGNKAIAEKNFDEAMWVTISFAGQLDLVNQRVVRFFSYYCYALSSSYMLMYFQWEIHAGNWDRTDQPHPLLEQISGICLQERLWACTRRRKQSHRDQAGLGQRLGP